MKRIPLAALVFALVATLFVLQDSAQAGDNMRVLSKGVTLSGQVSPDGKVLRTDDDNDWNVSNTDALKGFQGRYVTVKCRIDQDKRAIRILHVIEPDQSRRSANLGDPAFRR